MPALDDVRILDLSRLLPGPFCTLLLADLGADVIKVEDTDTGDYLRWMPPMAGDASAMFHALNRNKRSVALNLKSAAGRDAFLTLVEGADVVVESFRPGVIDRLRIGWDDLRSRNPRVILCSISGYGQDGPYRDRAGHDLNYAAIAGALSLSVDAQGRPAMPGVQAGDLGGGAAHAAVAILAALHQRERSGRGQHCDVAMLDGLVSWLAPQVAAASAAGIPAEPATLTLHGRHPCYRVYACADGYLAVGALEPKFWRALVHALGLPHLAGAGLASGEEAERTAAEVEAVLRQRTRSGWAAALDGLDVCVEPVQRPDQALDNAQVRRRGLCLQPGDVAPVATCGPPLRLSDSPFVVSRPAPGHGEHTREVLAAAGYAAGALDQLIAGGGAR